MAGTVVEFVQNRGCIGGGGVDIVMGMKLSTLFLHLKMAMPLSINNIIQKVNEYIKVNQLIAHTFGFSSTVCSTFSRWD